MKDVYMNKQRSIAYLVDHNMHLITEFYLDTHTFTIYNPSNQTKEEISLILDAWAKTGEIFKILSGEKLFNDIMINVQIGNLSLPELNERIEGLVL